MDKCKDGGICGLGGMCSDCPMADTEIEESTSERFDGTKSALNALSIKG